MLMTEAFKIDVCNIKDLEASILKVELSIYLEDMCSSILIGSNVKFCREIKESVNSELLEDRKEEDLKSFYEPVQGYIIYLKPGKVTELSSPDTESVFNKNIGSRSVVEEEMGLARASCVSKLIINTLNIRIEPATLEKLLKFIPKDPSSPEIHSVGFSVDIKTITIELLDREKVQKQVVPSMFSYYSLDASVIRTVAVGSDSSIGLVSINLFDLKLLFLTNCIENQGKYTKIKIKNIEAYAKHQELFYSLTPNTLSITIEKNKIEEMVVSLEKCVVSLDTLNQYSKFLSSFAVDFGKTADFLSKKKIVVSGIFVDYMKNDQRVLACIDSGNIEIVSKNELSLGVHAAVDSLRVYIQDQIHQSHPIFSIPLLYQKYEQELMNSGFLLIGTMDSMEFFITIVNSRPDIKSPQEDCFLPSFLQCMLGSNNCKKVSNSIFISNEVRSSILLNKLLDIHFNLGTCFLHLNFEIIRFLSGIINMPKPSEENEEMIRKDSDLSSDDSDYFPIQTAGLTINPRDPGRITNINLQDYLNPSKTQAKKLIKVLNESKTKLTKCTVVHTHSTIPAVYRDNSVDNSMHSLLPTHGCPNIRFSANLSYFVINLYSRTQYYEKSFPKDYGQGRVLLKSENLSITISKFPKKLHYS